LILLAFRLGGHDRREGFTPGFTSWGHRRSSRFFLGAVADRPGEQRHLARVAVHVAPVVALDHLDRGPAVVGEPFQVDARRAQGLRDKRVSGGVELPRPHARGAERAVPMLLHEPLLVDRRAGRSREDEGIVGRV
jgi:hypothetical protein